MAGTGTGRDQRSGGFARQYQIPAASAMPGSDEPGGWAQDGKRPCDSPEQRWEPSPWGARTSRESPGLLRAQAPPERS